EALRLLFMRQTDFDVVACCADARSAKDAVRAHVPDVAMVDLRMPGVVEGSIVDLSRVSIIAQRRS
ncbi:MAG TPA: hypothetical protein VNC21_05920, partial [Vicinamibacterales bacterium]|nr:hypothetical protein [Vicinamibacterales bacterium]